MGWNNFLGHRWSYPDWVPCQQTETGVAFVSLQILHLATDTVFAGGQSPNVKPPLGLLTPNKDYNMAPANQIFYIFFFLNLYSLSF